MDCFNIPSPWPALWNMHLFLQYRGRQINSNIGILNKWGGKLLAKLSVKLVGFWIRTIISESQPWQQDSVRGASGWTLGTKHSQWEKVPAGCGNPFPSSSPPAASCVYASPRWKLYSPWSCYTVQLWHSWSLEDSLSIPKKRVWLCENKVFFKKRLRSIQSFIFLPYFQISKS